VAGVSVRSLEKVSHEWSLTLLASQQQEANWKAQRYLHSGTSKLEDELAVYWMGTQGSKK